MALENVDFNSLSAADLLRLIENGVAEGREIEYKRDPIGRADEEKKEFLKDVSSFVNGAGGHIIIGMRTEDGVATELVGIEVADLDAEVQRLDSMIRDNLEPRTIGVQVRSVSGGNGRSVLVVRIPRSWSPPHRVSFRGWNKFFVRNSNGAHEANVEELRSMFTAGAQLTDRIRQFRDERIEAILRGDTPIPVKRDGQFVLHIVPFSFLGKPLVDLQWVVSNPQHFTPFSGASSIPSYNFDGVITTPGSAIDGFYRAYVQVFRNGCVESVCGGEIRGRDGNRYCRQVEPSVFPALPNYCNGLSALRVPPPVAVMISVLGVRGTALLIHNPWHDTQKLVQRDNLLLPQISLQSLQLEGNWHLIFKPAIDVIWNAYGFAECPHFTAEGVWQPPR